VKALPRARDATDIVPALKQPFRLPSKATFFQATRRRR
jgi:hypothetical protein